MSTSVFVVYGRLVYMFILVFYVCIGDSPTLYPSTRFNIDQFRLYLRVLVVIGDAIMYLVFISSPCNANRIHCVVVIYFYAI